MNFFSRITLGVNQGTRGKKDNTIFLYPNLEGVLRQTFLIILDCNYYYKFKTLKLLSFLE